MSELIINDLFDELKEENNRLLSELLLSQKRNDLLEKYRNYLLYLSNNCKCNQNFGNKNIINLLENEYKSVFNNNEKQSQKIQKNIDLSEGNIDLTEENNEHFLLNLNESESHFEESPLFMNNKNNDIIKVEVNETIIESDNDLDVNEDNFNYNNIQREYVSNVYINNKKVNKTSNNSSLNYINEEIINEKDMISKSDSTTPSKRKNQQMSNEIRALVIHHFKSGVSQKHISVMFRLNYDSVRTIIRTYKKTGSIQKKPTGHRRKLLNDHQKEQLRDWVDEDCNLTLDQLKQLCFERLGVELSLSTVERALRAFHYTIKRVTEVHITRNTPDVINKRFDYVVLYNQIRERRHQIYFIDKTEVEVWSRTTYSRPTYSRSTYSRSAGNHPIKKVKAIRSEKYSIATAMNRKSLDFFEIQNKHNSQDYSEFLSKLMSHLSSNGIVGAYLVMDSVRFQMTERVVNLINSCGHYSVFLPPFSPFLNPMEHLFSEWKNFIKRAEPQNEDQLYELVHSSSEKITSENCIHYFENMETYLHRCLIKEEITN